VARTEQNVNIVTLDIETYYDKNYSLSKITTEEYIRSDKFEVIGIGVQIDGENLWASGTHAQLATWLKNLTDWSNTALLAQNTAFDAAILSWVFDIHPARLLDTMSMARALLGPNASVSLASLAKHFKVGEKGTEVIKALGMRRADFNELTLSEYGDYCINDVVLTRAIYDKMIGDFPESELQIIDTTLKMFTEPVLRLDIAGLKAHMTSVQEKKAKLLADSGITVEHLMSNDKFAAILKVLGVDPPTKTSPKTGKEAYAFAKTDEALVALQDHWDPRVQTVVAARLGVKSTLEESRTQRFIDIAERGLLPIPLRYYAAHTGRWGGDDKINMQNLPSRGANKNTLKRCVLAAAGYKIIDTDSAQIEARVLAWLAGQDDVVEAFRAKKDVYKKMASVIYNKPEYEITDAERFIGKTAVLGCGYGLGAERLQVQLKNSGVDIDIDMARRIIVAYRSANDKIVALWKQAKNFIAAIERGDSAPLGVLAVLRADPVNRGIILPNGLRMCYEDLRVHDGENGPEYTYKTRYGRTRIYGGKLIENVCQALACCIIKHQMNLISPTYRVVMTVHDAIGVVVPDAAVIPAKLYIEEVMRTSPDWAPGLALNCESGYGQSYGDC
jgi:DNA polymerase